MKRIAISLVVAGGCLVLLAGCGSSMGPAVRRELTLGFSAEQQAAMQAIDTRSYVVRRGDVLAIHDLYNAEIEQNEVRVLPDGRATFIGLDQVRVAGLTLDEIDELLTREYSKEFREPHLTVSVRELGANNVYVLGEVDKPGSYEIPGSGYSILGAIALAGGFTKVADRSSVVLVRVTPQGYMCREMNLKGFTSGRVFDPALIDLQPYDVIYVNRTAIGNFAAFTDGLIRSLLQYTSLAVDMKYILNGDIIRR